MCVPVVAVPIIIGQISSILTVMSKGQEGNTGSGPVEVGGSLVNRGNDGTGVTPPKVIPSTVKVAPSKGNEIVSPPTTILVGPIMILDPSGPVMV